jgi:hypothetical protein
MPLKNPTFYGNASVTSALIAGRIDSGSPRVYPPPPHLLYKWAGWTLGDRKDYKAKMIRSKVGWGWGKFAEGLVIFSVSQDSHHGGNRRGGTSVYIRSCYSKGVKRRLWPKHQLIYTIVPPCTPWLAPRVQQTKTRKMSSLRKVATSLL